MPQGRIFSMGPWRWGVVLLVLASVPMRLHGLDRSLWLDETWLANSVLEPDLPSVFYYEPWLQTTPPVFLILERIAVTTLPLDNWTFRLLPFLFGVLGVGAMAWLAVRLLRPPAAFLVLLMFALAPAHVIYSQTLKQYTSDVLVSILLLGLGLLYLRYRSDRTLLACIGGFAVLAGLSYNAVLFMPAMLYGALFSPPGRERLLPLWQPRWRHAFALIGATAAAGLINYVMFIAPNLNQNIGFGTAEGSSSSALTYPLQRALSLLAPFKHFFFNAGPPWGGPWLAALIAGAALVAFAGLVHLVVRGGRGMPRNLDRAAVLALPIGAAFVLDLGGYYPLAVARLNLFLLPCVLILFGVGLQASIARARLVIQGQQIELPRRPGLRPYRLIALAMAALFIGRLAVGGPSAAPYFAWHSPSDEESQAAVAHLAALAGPGSVVYVDTSMLEPVKLYTRLTPLDGARLIDGRIAWPCCPRHVIVDRGDSPLEGLRREVDRIFERGPGDTLWMIHTARGYRWQSAGANYPELFDQHLRRRGCRPVESPDFSGVVLRRYECPAEGPDRAASAGPAPPPQEVSE